MTVEFFMPMKKPPTTTHQQKQVNLKLSIQKGKPMFYEPDSLKQARSLLMAHLGQHVPDEIYTKPVRLFVKWCFPITGKHTNGKYKHTKPDIDNSQKLLFDCMTDLGFWKDDSLIVSLIAEKFWADLPGIYIKIEKV